MDDTVRGEIEGPSRQEEYVSRSLNKVMLIGNLGNDPEVRRIYLGENFYFPPVYATELDR